MGRSGAIFHWSDQLGLSRITSVRESVRCACGGWPGSRKTENRSRRLSVLFSCFPAQRAWAVFHGWSRSDRWADSLWRGRSERMTLLCRLRRPIRPTVPSARSVCSEIFVRVASRRIPGPSGGFSSATSRLPLAGTANGQSWPHAGFHHSSCHPSAASPRPLGTDRGAGQAFKIFSCPLLPLHVCLV